MTTITGTVSTPVTISGTVTALETKEYPIGTKSRVNQTAHGFAVGDVVTFKSGSFADYTTGDAFAGLVVSVEDADNLTILTSGYTASLSGLTANTVYYAQSNGSLGTAVTELPIFLATSATAGYLILAPPPDNVNFVKSLSDITDGDTPSVDCLNYDQAKAFWSTAESTPTLSISNMGKILDLSIKKTIAGDTTVTLSGTGYKFVDMDSKAIPASTVNIVLSDTVNFYFEISIKKSGDTDGGDDVLLVQSK